MSVLFDTLFNFIIAMQMIKINSRIYVVICSISSQKIQEQRTNINIQKKYSKNVTRL
jgi:hypothetical protein